MFGTIYFMRPKPGAEAAIKDLMRREEKERTARPDSLPATCSVPGRDPES